MDKEMIDRVTINGFRKAINILTLTDVRANALVRLVFFVLFMFTLQTVFEIKEIKLDHWVAKILVISGFLWVLGPTIRWWISHLDIETEE